MRIAILISFIVPFIHSHGYGKNIMKAKNNSLEIAWLSFNIPLDFVCPNGNSMQTILVGRGESYSLTFKPSKSNVNVPSTCKVIYQPLSNEPTSCKTGLRFSCSKFILPNKDARKCSRGAKLATNARNRP